MKPRRVALFVCLLTLACGCARSDLVRAASSGDRARVAALVADRGKKGSLTNGEAVDLARTTLEHEVLTAPKDLVGARIGFLYACARQAESTLSKVARSHDEAGAKAAWLLVSSGARSASSFDASLNDSLEGFRAIAARAADDDSPSEARRLALLDPSPLVRRAGILAARNAGISDDLPLLRDRARLDPSPMVRSEALRALVFHPLESTEDILRLADDTDDTTRSEVATALATTRSADGGWFELRRLLASAPTRMSSLLGAAFVVRANRAGDPETIELANGIVIENLRRGGRTQKLTALRLAPLRSPFLEEVEAASRGGDRETMLTAWSRLLEVPSRERDAQAMLLRFAGNDYGRLSAEARLRLAERGRLDIQAWIERDLESTDPERHSLAIRALTKLDRVARAAPLLANVDANVRLRSACAILAEQ